MKGSSFDTRFFVELFYSSEERKLGRIKEVLLSSRPNYVSAAVLSEIYSLILSREGREVADLRAAAIRKDFHIVAVDSVIALEAGLIRHDSHIPFADSLVAATARVMKLACYTDDPHFGSVRGVSIRWLE